MAARSRVIAAPPEFAPILQDWVRVFASNRISDIGPCEVLEGWAKVSYSIRSEKTAIGKRNQSLAIKVNYIG